MITCNVCGTQNPEGTQYCEGCGVELAAPAKPAENPAPAPAAQPAAPAATPAPAAEVPAVAGEPTVAGEPAPPAEAVPPAQPAPASTPEAPAPVVPAAPQVTTLPANTPPVTATQEMPPAPPAEIFRPARLILKRFGALTKDEIPLQGARLVVGRFDASSGPVEVDLTGIPGAENISRRHAELTFEGNVWKVRDLGSTNGVFVKAAGQEAYSPRVVEPTAVKDGDELAFGNITMVFKEG